MALRDQPYIPLYVQDVLTDEKLIECSAEAHGIYFRLICILHKQEQYGVICLKQKYKQNKSKYENFAIMLGRQMPFDQKTIQKCLIELSDEGVLIITDVNITQKRMKKDGELSIIRSKSGKAGGSNVTKQYGKPGYLYFMSDGYNNCKIGISVNPKNRLYRIRSDHKLKSFEIYSTIKVVDMGKAEDFAQDYFKDVIDGEWIKHDYNIILKRFDLLKAKLEANPEYEYEDENENENKDSINKGANFNFDEEIKTRITEESKIKISSMYKLEPEQVDILLQNFIYIFEETPEKMESQLPGDTRQHFIRWCGSNHYKFDLTAPTTKEEILKLEDVDKW